MKRICLISMMFLGCGEKAGDPAAPPSAAVVDPVEQLMSEVRTGEPATRVAAAEKLAKLGKDAAKAVGALAEALNHPETRVKLAALNALEHLARAGVALEGLGQAAVGLLAHEAAPVRAQAAALLGHVQGLAEAAPALAERLGDEASEVRVAASRSLSRMGEGARPALARLASAVTDADVTVRMWARQAITTLDPSNPASLKPILAMMTDTRLPEAVRQQAQEILEGIVTGRPAELAPALTRVLEDAAPGHEQAVRALAMHAVKLVSDPANLPRVLLSAARNPDDPLRVLALQAIAALGARAKEAVAEIPGFLKDTDEAVRAAAATALGALKEGGQAVLPALEAALDDPAEAVRVASVEALGALMGKEEAERLVPRIAAMLKDTSQDVRAAAARALGQAGSLLDDASAALTPLMAAVADQSEAVAVAALEGLKSMGSKAKDALPVIMEGLKTGSAAVKTAAVDAVGAMGEAAGEVRPMMIRMMGSKDLDPALEALLKQVPPSAPASAPTSAPGSAP